MIDFDVASAWQSIFLFRLRLELMLDGVTELSYRSEADCDDRKCGLGRMLADLPASARQEPEFVTLDQAHQHFHEQAGQLVKLFQSGDTEHTQRFRDREFRLAADQLMHAIAAIKIDTAAMQAAAPALDHHAHLWHKGLAIGISAIDEQHRALASMIDELGEHENPGNDPSAGFSASLAVIGRLFALHFDTEEALLQQADLPEQQKNAHLQAHREMLNRIDMINQSTRQTSPLGTTEILQILRTWVADHVSSHDSRLKTLARQMN